MKRLLVLLLVALTAFAFVACGDDEESEAPATTSEPDTPDEPAPPVAADIEYEDGIYFAQEDAFGSSGWKYMAILEVEGGKIVDAVWNGASTDGGTDKITRSKSGEYGMVDYGGAQWPWWEQAEKAEAYLIATQDPTAINYTTEAGNTDSFTGATIHVREFFDLAEKAIEQGPVGRGPYTDGTYSAEAAEFSETSGWKDTVSLTVINGHIVSAAWDAIHKDGGTGKDERSREGEYGMVENGGSQWPWWEQAEKAEQYLLETQDPTAITYTENGYTDAFSGATIHVNAFFELAEEALAGAR